MTDTHDYAHFKIFSTENMKLTSSASEQNVYFTYVCLVDKIQPISPQIDKSCHRIDPQDKGVNQEEQTIQVARTKADHGLAESLKHDYQIDKGIRDTDSSTPYPTTTSDENSESDLEDNNFISCDNPNILKLTKMKWLTEEHANSPNSSSTSLSPASSTTSSCSKTSECDVNKCDHYDDKYLSTILRLDKEHNMFGLSSIAIIGSRPSKQKRMKEDETPVFPQTAIVQICCAKGCCRYSSKTNLPSSLKRGGCKSCCFDPTCSLCGVDPCVPSVCSGWCPKETYSCGGSCLTLAGKVDCNNYYGLKIKLNRKPKFEPPPVELTPRSSCILKKPFAARSCHHTPLCIPPSSCFPYLMPCFWPARPSAPCSSPTRCFHNPPCPPARSRRKVPLPPEYRCPRHGKCENKEKNTKCTNEVCPGCQRVLAVSEKKKKKQKKHWNICECWKPMCKKCFVMKPKKLLADSSDLARNKKILPIRRN